jgi:hypothetical protein
LIQAVKQIGIVKVDDVETNKVKQWIFVVVAFLMMLISSLKALASVTVSTLVVFRNLNTLLVAFGEYPSLVQIQREILYDLESKRKFGDLMVLNEIMILLNALIQPHSTMKLTLNLAHCLHSLIQTS